jgi:hypothetical protein
VKRSSPRAQNPRQQRKGTSLSSKNLGWRSKCECISTSVNRLALKMLVYRYMRTYREATSKNSSKTERDDRRRQVCCNQIEVITQTFRVWVFSRGFTIRRHGATNGPCKQGEVSCRGSCREYCETCEHPTRATIANKAALLKTSNVTNTLVENNACSGD